MYLYVKIFDNGKMYVGITIDFNRRMREHQYDTFIGNSQYLVHRAMRKHNHRTEIWVDDIDDRELLEQLEIQTIAQLKESGIELYNTTDGGEGFLGIIRKIGKEHHMFGKHHSEETKKKISQAKKGKYTGSENSKSKPMEYYAKNPTRRDHFKIICNNQNWKFEDFEEMFSGDKSGRKYKYYYIYRG